ncbi:hypothetical protein [Lyngbya aestuarii]|uniref:hypothetical protein n=1 Tax=Lyngbya aestuarii TaxID=118322 RepID=UPI00403DEBFD
MVNNQVDFLLGATLLALTSLSSSTELAMAQHTVSVCQPPKPGEYILLVPSQTREVHQQVQRTLPPNTEANRCQYLEQTVTRVAGFGSLDDANDWASYVKNSLGLSAFVVRAAPAALPTSPQSYNPRPLGDGYAVLVDYFHQPEVASQVKQFIGEDIGLVSYGQRHYLLAVYTTNQTVANSVLQQLSDRGFWSLVVDSRRVTLLGPIINF